MPAPRTAGRRSQRLPPEGEPQPGRGRRRRCSSARPGRLAFTIAEAGLLTTGVFVAAGESDAAARITGAFVGSAFGAARFYGTKKSAAMELTSKLLNDDRDEDREGPAGFESKAERARLFAAEMGLQSFAVLAAAEGAIAAYADITGETWKPYQEQLAAPATVARKSAAVEMAAFQSS